MSTPAERVIRVLAPFGTLASLLRNRDKVAADAPGKLTAHDLVAVTGRGICRQWTLVAGLPVDHGTVADEATMLALHVDSAETPPPRWVVPGDSCTRADDPGWRWHCISGHGQALSDWERRPLGAALSGLAVSGHTHAISAVTGLQTALDGKQPASAVLSDLSDVSGSLAYKGTVIAGGGGTQLWDDQSVQMWYDADASPPLGVDGVAGDGDAIVAWRDLSRYGRVAKQLTAGNRPTWSDAESAVKFASGSSQHIQTAKIAPNDTGLVGDLTLYVLARRSADSGTCLYCGTAVDNYRVSMYWESGSITCVVGTSSVASWAYTPTTSWTLLEIRWRGTSASLYAGGSLVGTVTATHAHNTAPWETWKIGIYNGTQSLDLYLRALVLLDGGASDAYCDAVRAALLP